MQILILTICQTCMMLSSDTEQITQGSLGFHEKSEILAVCPPWMKRSSPGPSSASSGDCSSPILLKSSKSMQSAYLLNIISDKECNLFGCTGRCGCFWHILKGQYRHDQQGMESEC